MKKAFRVIWVIAANGFVIGLTYTRLAPGLFSSETQNFETWLEILIEMAVPCMGIAAELLGWKFAKWVNVGCLTFAACFWLGEAVWWRADPFFGVLLIISFVMFFLAGLTEIIYQRTKDTRLIRWR